MRLFRRFVCCSALFLSVNAAARVKDSSGKELGIGQPAKPVADFDGGTIGRGRAAKCAVDAEALQNCIFYPRNNNGGFAIDVGGMAFYADKVSATRISVDYDNGARMVPQGAFIRSKRDPACWLQGSSRKICVY